MTNIEALETMRRKYFEQFIKKYKTKEVQTVEPIRELTEAEIKAFEEAKNTLANLIEAQRNTTLPKQRKDNISQANQTVKSILDLPLDLDRLEELFDIYESVEFSNFFLARDDVKYSKHRHIKRELVDKIASRVESEMAATDDIVELQNLSQKIKLKYDSNQLGNLSNVRISLRTKISNLRNKIAKERKMETSPIVDGITKGLARWKFKCRKC